MAMSRSGRSLRRPGARGRAPPTICSSPATRTTHWPPLPGGSGRRSRRRSRPADDLSAAMNYTHLKDLISQYTGLEKDALHIHAALFIYILVAFLVRKSPRSALPWLAVFVIELANEAHDVWDNWGAPAGWIVGESGKDLWNTMLWPTVLLIAVR